MPTSHQFLCPERTNLARKVQDPLNNLIEAASCRFSTGEHPTKQCVLIHSPDAYHPKVVGVTRADCLYCTQTLSLPRSPYSTSYTRSAITAWWKRWATTTRDR